METKKKIVRVESKTTNENVSLNKDGKIVMVKEEDKSSAKSKRIIGVILWVLAIACEIIAILNVFGKIDLPKLSQTVWLVGLILLDLIFVVIGSNLWKKANHIDPVSEKNKTKFWLWNNLGSIVSVIAFLPLIIIVLLNKDMDKKSKTIVSVIGISSYDWSPVSSEQLENARAEILANGNYDVDENGKPIVYWLEHSKKYHINSNCSAINRSNTTDTIYSGTIDAAFQKGLTEPCRICIKAMEKTNTTENKE